MTIDPVNFAAILAMGALTYFTRILGFLVADRLPKSGPVRVALDALPPAVLVAVIAPIVMAGPIEAAAGVVVLVLALRLPLIATVAVGVAVAALLRFAFL
ncbi:AzlD family protein [Pleomorphomonas sp. JP5]|uniref:AzlD family protein n=1 Tax=Pleomorphomonas sp. JP5 TaxID=2942998 RepID=UPI00204326E0|nr:AzlD domain-containing protein [Pleomorphomonas sp. JP5]MCM5556946.1 AzlD domain-containing protein [Pleomorphomonas sp. JP5]